MITKNVSFDHNNLTNDDLKKHLSEQINIEDWTDRCNKCGHPKLIHKNLHRDATCTEKQAAPDDLNKYWEEYTKRIKPVLKIIKEDLRKDMHDRILRKGLKELLESNTKNILSQTKQMNEKWASMMTIAKNRESKNKGFFHTQLKRLESTE